MPTVNEQAQKLFKLFTNPNISQHAFGAKYAHVTRAYWSEKLPLLFDLLLI